jgi:hypothetical protein
MEHATSRDVLMHPDTNEESGTSPCLDQVQDASDPADHHVPAARSRATKAHIGAYLDVNFRRSLRMVQAQTDKDMQQLIADALNLLFRKHNVPVVGEE